MKGNITVARILGIPVVVNVSWLVMFALITSMLALRVYPDVLETTRYGNDKLLHWLLALASGIVFFLSILLHELAHSVVARKQGLPVHSITLFILGGVSQIGGEATRPRNEFVMAIVGPLTSLVLAGVFFAAWAAVGITNESPLALALSWLCVMNAFIAIFNMLPGYPLDGGRVLRSIVWGITGNLHKSTRIATVAGRGVGYTMMIIGGLAFLGLIDEFVNQWSGPVLVLLGMFIESTARQSWIQSRALETLSAYKAEDLMYRDLALTGREEQLRYLVNRGGRRYIFFVSDDDEEVVGVLTEKEVEALGPDRGLTVTAGDAMKQTAATLVAALQEDGASLLQKMETAAVWHLPIVAEGRVVGVVSKESLLRLLARTLLPRPRLADPT